jgi:transcriptional regulator with XRE-family HTH domain
MEPAEAEDLAGTFGQVLRQLRLSAGLSLRELGQRALYDYSRLSRAERDEITIPLEQVQALDELLGAGGKLVELRRDTDAGERVIPYADRGLISRRQRNGIIAGRTTEVWLYGMAEYGYATDDDVPGILAGSAAPAEGVPVSELITATGMSRRWVFYRLRELAA